MPPSRRDELVDTAMRVFYRHGFHASGLEKVLSESGISRMTLYNHFKSKDELIVAALRRRDETLRNRMMKFVEAKSESPEARLLAVFDFVEDWACGDEFCGCMFINASAEFGDPTCAVRQVTAEHKRAITRYLTELGQQAGFAKPELVASQLNLLVEGAIVTAQVVGQVDHKGSDTGASIRLAKEMARGVLASAARV